jgi:erythrocyte band 7 integral membrane protein
VAAEGEYKASYALKDAAEIISCSPIALQLRYMQTLASNATERESTIVFPIPIEMMQITPNLNIDLDINHYNI